MFSDVELFYRQHNGQFGICWIVATRGIKHITKKQILSINIVSVSNNLIKYIISNSKDKTQRMSLRLSAFLLNGLIRIYMEQVTICYGECVTVFTQVTVPNIFSTIPVSKSKAIFSVPDSPIPIGKKKRKPKKAVEISPDIIGDLERVIEGLAKQATTTVTARNEDITLREDLPIQRPDDLLLDLGDMGGPILDPSVLALPVQDIMMIDLPFFNEQPPQKDLEKGRTSRSSTESQAIGPKITTVAQVLRENEQDIVIPQEITIPEVQPELTVVPPDTIIPEITAQPEVRVQPEIVLPEHTLEEVVQPKHADKEQLNVVSSSEEDIGRKVLKLFKKSQDSEEVLVGIPQNFIRKRRLPRFVKINIWNYGDTYNNKYPSLYKPIGILETPIVNFKFFIDYDRVRGLSITSVSSTEGSLRESAAHQRKTDSIKTPEINIPKHTSTPIKRKSELTLDTPLAKRQLLGEPSIIEELSTMAPPELVITAPPIAPQPPTIEEEIPFSMAPVETMVEGHSTVPMEVAPVPLEQVPLPTEQFPAPMEQEAVPMEQQQILPEDVTLFIPESMQPVDTKTSIEIRQQKIVDIVKNWNVEENGILGLEDVAEKPLTKLSVSRAFYDVLVLTKMRFLVLHSDEDSNELKRIEKGPKLL